jgi:hypothetical protein
MWVGLPIGAAAVGLGCAKKGDTGGRIDSYSTTRSDKGSTGANVGSMLEFCDTTAEEIAKQISEIPEFKEAPSRLVIELGSLLNKTRTPTTDFELIQRRLRGRLMRSKHVTNNFMFVESRARSEAELERVQGKDADLLQEGKNTGGTARYDPKLTYVMTGDFLEAVRGDRRQYYFEIKLTNLASRAIVFTNSFDLGQVTSR